MRGPCFPVQPVAILDRQVRKLRSKEISLVKVLWRSDQVEEENWEPEEAMRRQYPHLFAVCYLLVLRTKLNFRGLKNVTPEKKKRRCCVLE